MKEFTPIELADLNQQIGCRKFWNMGDLDIYGLDVKLNIKGAIKSVDGVLTDEEQLMEELIQSRSKFTTAVERVETHMPC